MSNPHSSATAGHGDVHVKSYMIVFGALLVLTGVTVGLSYIDFGSHAANIVVGMIVATVKASLVALVFMHLNHEKRHIYVLLAFTLFFFFGLFILTWLHYWDPILIRG